MAPPTTDEAAPSRGTRDGLLLGRVVLITGAGRGIGRAHAQLLAAEGARLVVNDLAPQSPSSGVDSLVELLKAGGFCAVADYSDISTWDGARVAVQRGIDEFGRLDGLVNNAGVLRRADVADLDESGLDAELNVNIKGTMACTHHASRYWRQQSRDGRRPDSAVVNSTSDAFLTGSPGGAGYAATKAAIVAFTQSASIEGAHYGVRHNAIAPSGLTPMAAGSGLLGSDPEALKSPEDQDPGSPVNPIHNSPLVAWLLSDRARHVTGQVFRLRFGAVSRVSPPTSGPWQRPPGDTYHWDAEELGTAIDAEIFNSRFPEPIREYPDGSKEPFSRLDHG
jgi:NAD(P)-dependent dehydrogenase (short-subunit alcohol dehydrogenase family)